MILANLPLEINAELVIRAQGLDFNLVKSKSPKLIEITKKAIEIGYPYLESRVAYERYPIDKITPTGLILEKGRILDGELIKNYFANSLGVVAAVCTVGSRIDELTMETFHQNPGLGMALAGFASVATEILGNSFCNYIDDLVIAEGLHTSLPINPGMTGWPVGDGQSQLFALVDPSSIGVELDPTGLIRPLKSLSMMISIDQKSSVHQKSCDFCNLQKTCIYKPDPVKINSTE